MTSENLVTIDFDSDTLNTEHNAEISVKSFNSARPKINEEPEIIFSGDSNLDEIINESQPLLGGTDHEIHQIIYNQFPIQSRII
ncbi:hypothetical protein PVAND_009929 [Polypedilum vanderplanki]|uniref:Uncharacterized protein n=1 Tax=Polypedilum vanderplanki TaxID=319348 RepID=A0A9J6CER6_POLVA|nr:hypothetical protein PVAND_009929 [Polypedilum vanderplanki]